jgi:hypothetical protein
MIESVTTGGISWMQLPYWLVFVLDIALLQASSRQLRKYELSSPMSSPADARFRMTKGAANAKQGNKI